MLNSRPDPIDGRRTYYEALFTLEQSSAVEVRGMLTLPAPPVQKRTDWPILM